MEKIIQSMFLLMVLFVFFLLFVLKIYNFESKEKRKYGFLISILLLSLTLISCGSILLTKKGKYKNLNTNSIQFNQAQIYQDSPIKIQELNKTSEWKSLKAFWKKLDLIEPGKENRNDPYYFEYKYTDSIEVKEAEELRQEMAETFGYKNYDNFRGEILYNITEEAKTSSKTGIKKLVSEGKVLPLEMEILAKICNERMDYMTMGFSSITTRMIISEIVIEKENSIAGLEHKIDLLIELCNNGKVSKDEFEIALDNIQNEIEAFVILDAIKSNYLPIHEYSYRNIENFDEDSAIEEYVAVFEQHYLDYKDEKKKSFYSGYDAEEVDKMYLKTKNEIKEIKKVLPALRELVADLER